VVLATRGGSSGSHAQTAASTGGAGAQTQTSATHHKHANASQPKQAKATPPAETAVIVLNGTL
jgi:hypothetical protein